MRENKHVSELVLVRHGESQLNVAQQEAIRNGHARFDGSIRQNNTPLTDQGLRQAEAVGKYLATAPPFYRVFVSPYLRTVQTADALTGQLPYKAEIRLDERIRERESGIFAGMTPAGIRDKYPDELERNRREGRYYFRPLGGESYPDVNLRVHSFLTSMKHNFAGRRILVICHSVVIWCFRRVLERLSESQLLSLLEDPDKQIPNASVTFYRADANGRLRLLEFAGTHYANEDAIEEQSSQLQSPKSFR